MGACARQHSPEGVGILFSLAARSDRCEKPGIRLVAGDTHQSITVIPVVSGHAVSTATLFTDAGAPIPGRLEFRA
jgi:hypothetical protein